MATVEIELESKAYSPEIQEDFAQEKLFVATFAGFKKTAHTLLSFLIFREVEVVGPRRRKQLRMLAKPFWELSNHTMKLTKKFLG